MTNGGRGSNVSFDGDQLFFFKNQLKMKCPGRYF
jgi:hypothetical protein